MSNTYIAPEYSFNGFFFIKWINESDNKHKLYMFYLSEKNRSYLIHSNFLRMDKSNGTAEG